MGNAEAPAGKFLLTCRVFIFAALFLKYNRFPGLSPQIRVESSRYFSQHRLSRRLFRLLISPSYAI